MPKKKQKQGTRAAAARTRKVIQAEELDGVFFLKLVLYLLVGSLWIKANHDPSVNISVPIGLMVGLAFTAHEHFQIDRKIEYALLLVAMFIGYFAPFGLYIAF